MKILFLTVVYSTIPLSLHVRSLYTWRPLITTTKRLRFHAFWLKYDAKYSQKNHNNNFEIRTRRQSKRSSFCSQAQKTEAGTEPFPTTLNNVTGEQPTDQIIEQELGMTSLFVGKVCSSAYHALHKTKSCPVSVTREEKLVRKPL